LRRWLSRLFANPPSCCLHPQAGLVDAQTAGVDEGLPGTDLGVALSDSSGHQGVERCR
jgi:hypothetical protein